MLGFDDLGEVQQEEEEEGEEEGVAMGGGGRGKDIRWQELAQYGWGYGAIQGVSVL